MAKLKITDAAGNILEQGYVNVVNNLIANPANFQAFAQAITRSPAKHASGLRSGPRSPRNVCREAKQLSLRPQDSRADKQY